MKHSGSLEEGLEGSEVKFKTLAEQSPNMIFISKEGRVVYVNPQCEKLMGYTRDEFYGPDFDVLSLIAPEDKELVMSRYAAHFRGEEVPPCEYTLVAKDGRRIEAIITTRLVDYEGEQAILGIGTDISQRKRMERALRESQERYRIVSELTSDYAYSIRVEPDNTLKMGWATERRESITGFTPEGVEAQGGWESLIHPDDISRARRHREVCFTGETVVSEYRIIRKNGEVRWIRDHSLPVWDEEEGRVVCIYGAVQDITPRKQAEESLRLLSTAVEQSTEGIAVSDMEGNLLFVNKAFATMHGYTPEELDGKHLSVFHTPEQMEVVERANRQIREVGQFNGEVWHTRRDGTRFPTLMQNTLLRDETGEPIGMIGAVRDITSYKRAEMALKQSEAQYRITIDAMADAIHVVDEDLQIILFNEAFKRWNKELGLEMDVIGQPLFEVFPFLSDRVRAQYRQVFETGEPLITTEEDIHIGETKFFTETRKIPIFEGERVIQVLTIVRNVSEQKRAEEALYHYAERLKSIREIDQAILVARSPVAIAEAALQRIGALVSCPWASVILYDFEMKEGAVLAVYLQNGLDLEIDRMFPLDEMGSLDLLQDGEIYMVEDVGAVSPLTGVDQALFDGGMRSYINVPLVAQGELVGSLILGASNPQMFDSECTDIVREVADSLAIAIQNARLLEAERQRSAELETLRRASLNLTSNLELQVVLETILHHALRLVSADDCHIFLYDGERLTFGAALWAGEHQKTPYATPREDGLTYTVARRGERIVVPDVNSHPLFEDWKWGGGIVGLPLLFGDQVIGVMTVAFETPRILGENELNVLELLADQAAVAVENARLFQAEQQQRRRLTLLADVARIAASALRVDEFLQSVVDSIHQLFHYPVVELFTLDEKEDSLLLQGYWGPPLETPDLTTPGVYRQLLNTGIIGHVARTGRSYIATDVEKDPYYHANRESTRSEICVPIQDEARVIGVLNVESNQLSSFDEEDRSLLEAVSDTVAVGLRNIRLYEEIQRRVQELTLLNRISVGFGATLELDALIDGALRGLQDLLLVDRAYFATIDPEEETWEITHERAIQEVESSLGLRGTFADISAEMEVLLTGRAWAVSDIEADPRIDTSREVYSALGARSGLLVGVRPRGRLYGVLGLDFCHRQHSWHTEEIRLLQGVARQMALALENIRLFQEVRRHAEELGAALDQLRELDRLKSEFIQNVSHELRSPLALIRGYAEMLQAGDLGELPPQQRGPMEVITRRTRMLGELVEDITLILGAEAHPLKRDPVALDEIAQRVVEDFAIVAEQGGVTLEVDIPPHLPPVGGEPLYLRRVVDNLLSNAVKFTPAEGKITLRMWEEGEQVSLQVMDTGIGIPLDQQERIFERFYQLDGSTRRRYGGVGLGLALVREVVEGLDGQIQVESEVGKGSTFAVTLPVFKEG